MPGPVVVGSADPTDAECVPDFCDRCERVMFVSGEGAELTRGGVLALCALCYSFAQSSGAW